MKEWVNEQIAFVYTVVMVASRLLVESEVVYVKQIYDQMWWGESQALCKDFYKCVFEALAVSDMLS